MPRFRHLGAALVISLAALQPAWAAATGPDVLDLLDTALNGMTRQRVKAISQLASLDAETIAKHKILKVLLKRLATNGKVNVRARIAAIAAAADLVQRTLPDEKQTVTPELVRMLRNTTEALLARKESARGLGKLCSADDVGDVPTIRALEGIAAGERENAGLRALCIEAIGRIGHEGSFRILRPLLSEKDPVIRRKVAVAISSFLRQHKPDLNTMKQILKLAGDKALDIETRVDFLRAVGSGGREFKTLSAGLISMLGADNDRQIHTEIIKSLAVMGDPKAVPALISAYKRFKGADGAELRSLVTEGLGEFYEALAASKSPSAARASKTVTETLVKALNEDADADVCSAAAFALGNIPRRFDRSKAAASLIEALTDQDKGVRASSLNSLKILTDQELGQDVERWRLWYKANERALRMGR